MGEDDSAAETGLVARGPLITFGETLVRLAAPEVGPLRHATHLRLRVVGAESNVAIGVRRLGMPAIWLGRVGDDELGRLVVSRIQGEGVDTRAIFDRTAQTGLMLTDRRLPHLARWLSPNGQRRVEAAC